MRFIDLNSNPLQSHTRASVREEMADEFRKDGVLSSDGLFTGLRVSPLRGSLPRQLQSEKFFMLGSISLNGLCSAHLSRKSQGHRDLSAGAGEKLYHMGIRSKVSRNTLAHANELRDWRIYHDFAQVLIHNARELHQNDPLAVQLDQTAYALDSTVVDLCLSLFPWAKFRKRKAAVKLHTLLDLRASIPTTVIVTTGAVHDVNIMDELFWEPGSIYVMDRGYVDFSRLYRIQQDSAFFVTRAKKNFRFQRLYSHPVNKSIGLRCDQIVTLCGFYAQKDYPEKLRRVRFFDVQTNKALVFLTNNFTLPPLTIAQLYRCRWQVELFFKWIKQHLRIKAFYGTSDNAVKTQIWIAISIYVLVAIVKKRLNLDYSLYSILQILSVTILEKTPILHVLSQLDESEKTPDDNKQLILFN
jgi:transposase